MTTASQNGSAAEKPDHAGQRRRPRHDGDQETAAAESGGGLVPQDAGRQAQQQDDGAEHRHHGRNAAVGHHSLIEGEGERQEGDQPRAQAEQLVAVGGIGQDVAHGRPVAQHGAEVQQSLRRRYAFRPGFGDAPPRQRQRHGRGGRRSGEGGAPVHRSADKAGEQHRSAGTQRVAGGVEGEIAALARTRRIVRQDAEAGHIGAGEPDPADRPVQRGAP